MALAFVGVDPDTKDGGSPTVWVDQDTREIVVQGWKAGAVMRERMTATLAPGREAGIPEGEDVVRVPARLAEALRKACGMPAFGETDRETQNGGSLTVWLDEDTGEIVIRGRKVDAVLRVQIIATPPPDHEPGIPEGEDVVRVPASQVEALRRVAMQQIDWAEFIGKARSTAVHLEMRDVYAVAGEAAEFAAWQETGAIDLDPDSESWREWAKIVRDATARGVQVRRARIVSEPVTAYTRWLHQSTPVNLAVGVRWLPRSRASDISLPGNDFWVLDGSLVQFHHFTGDGDWAPESFEHSRQPFVVKKCTDAFEQVWARGVPHEDYKIS